MHRGGVLVTSPNSDACLLTTRVSHDISGEDEPPDPTSKKGAKYGDRVI